MFRARSFSCCHQAKNNGGRIFYLLLQVSLLGKKSRRDGSGQQDTNHPGEQNVQRIPLHGTSQMHPEETHVKIKEYSYETIGASAFRQVVN